MTISPEKLRSALEVDSAFVAIEKRDVQVLIDALEIADSCARSDIESFCGPIVNAKWQQEWWNVQEAGADEREMVDRAVRYLEARGLLERKDGEPHLVRVREGG